MRLLFLPLVVFGLAACARTRCCPPPATAEVPRPVRVEVQDQVFIDIQCARVRVDGRMHELTKRGAPPAPGATFAKRLTAEQAAARVAKWEADARVEVVQAPKILALDQQIATVMVGESPTGANPGEPEFLGSFFRVTPVVRGDDIRIEYHHRIKLTDPAVIRADMTKREWASAVAAMTYAEADVDFGVPSGGFVLIQSGQKIHHSEGNFWVETLVHVRRLPRANASAIRVQHPPVIDGVPR